MHRIQQHAIEGRYDGFQWYVCLPCPVYELTKKTEPGYYADGDYGIRIENVVIVCEARTPYNFGDKGYLGFEHVTMVCLALR
jgi:hypothetical protein